MANSSGTKIYDFDKRFDLPRGAIRLPRYSKRIVYIYVCTAWMTIAETHSASRRARMFLNLPGVCVGDLSSWPVPLERACLRTCVNCATRNAEGWGRVSSKVICSGESTRVHRPVAKPSCGRSRTGIRITDRRMVVSSNFAFLISDFNGAFLALAQTPGMLTA